MKGVIVVGNCLDPNLACEECAGAFVIGADKGARYCLQNGIEMDLALGDFDSLSLIEKKEIEKKAKKVIELNPVKDDTDTAHALSLLPFCSEIVVLGGIQGKRIEHFLAILDLLAKDSRVVLKDSNSFIKIFGPGEYDVDKGDYRFVSFFALEDAVLSLEGFAYPLKERLLERFDPLGVSNEIIGEMGRLDLKSGRLLMVCSKDDA